MCAIITATVGVDSCVTIFILNVINKLIVTNTSDSINGIKEYSTEGNENF